MDPFPKKVPTARAGVESFFSTGTGSQKEEEEGGKEEEREGRREGKGLYQRWGPPLLPR